MADTESNPFEYALLRVVPRVERGEFINAGVVLYCQEQRFLDARIHLDHARLKALDPRLEPEIVLDHLNAAQKICVGGSEAGPIGLLPPVQRFGWLTAPRSAIVQPSPIHTGLTTDPEETLDHLLRVMVRAPEY